MIKNISLLFGSLIFVVILAEITLQFMPVSEGFDFQDVNDENWSFHSRPERRMVQASIGPAMRVNIKKQVNDSGFVNPLIYLKQNSNGPPSFIVLLHTLFQMPSTFVTCLEAGLL